MWRILSEGALSFLPQAALQEAPGVPFVGMCDHRAWEAVGFLTSSFPDFLCCVSVSASPARSPVFSHLASSLRGLWTIRAYKAEQKFQELFDAHQDLHSGLSVSGDDFKGWDVLPSEADLPLRWPSRPAPLSVSLLIPLCTPASPTPSSQHPLSAPVFPVIPCFSLLTGSHCPCITVPCRLLSL